MACCRGAVSGRTACRVHSPSAMASGGSARGLACGSCRRWRLRAAKSAALLSLLVVGSTGEAATPSVVLVDIHTRRRLLIGDVLPSPHEINDFFRCRADQRYTLMDPRLVTLAVAAARAFDQPTVEVLSAFRTRHRNDAMRAAGREVALRSRHMHGQALDLRLPGVSLTRLCLFFLRLTRGGVGCYRERQFVHVDVGPPRSWQR